jgi:hypothetical protein
MIVGIGYMPTVACHLPCINASSNGSEIHWSLVLGETSLTVVATEAQG